MKSNFWNENRVLGSIFLAIAAIVILATTRVQMPKVLHEPGPRIFPYLCGGGLGLCGFCLMFEKPKGKPKQYLDKAGWLRVLKCFLLLVLYAVLMYLFGYFISTLISSFLMMRVLSHGKASWLSTILVTVLTTGIVYVVFIYVLKTILPAGLLL